MELNADFSQRVVVRAARFAWIPSPMAGVDRRMLDRLRDEVARATSIVRYAPDSHLSAHTRGGGEEFIVLEGVFQDEHGDFPAGSYIRNPPTSRHTPGSAPGCVIFVKLWQFDPEDRTQIRIDTGAMSYTPALGRPGVELKSLFLDSHEDVRLERWASGARIALDVPGGVAPRRGSTSPRFSFSLGDWPVTDATYTILSRTLSRAYTDGNRSGKVRGGNTEGNTPVEKLYNIINLVTLITL